MVALDIGHDAPLASVKTVLVAGEADGSWFYDEGCISEEAEIVVGRWNAIDDRAARSRVGLQFCVLANSAASCCTIAVRSTPIAHA